MSQTTNLRIHLKRYLITRLHEGNVTVELFKTILYTTWQFVRAFLGVFGTRDVYDEKYVEKMGYRRVNNLGK